MIVKIREGADQKPVEEFTYLEVDPKSTIEDLLVLYSVH